jgi:hypothetical protein
LDGDVYEFADPCPPSMRNVRLGTEKDIKKQRKYGIR